MDGDDLPSFINRAPKNNFSISTKLVDDDDDDDVKKRNGKKVTKKAKKFICHVVTTHTHTDIRATEFRKYFFPLGSRNSAWVFFSSRKPKTMEKNTHHHHHPYYDFIRDMIFFFRSVSIKTN